MCDPPWTLGALAMAHVKKRLASQECKCVPKSVQHLCGNSVNFYAGVQLNQLTLVV